MLIADVLDTVDQAQSTALVPREPTSAALSQAAAAADRAASSALFAEYRRQLAARTGNVERRTQNVERPVRTPLFCALRSTLYVLAVEGFKRWMLREDYALATLNRILATIKSYTRLAAQAGALAAEQAALIAAVKGYGRKQGRNLDADRATTRRSAKKPQAVRLSLAHARALKEQPGDTPQGRCDALLICLLLDHGLRVGELAALTVGSVNLAADTLTFYREKVDLTQTHLLSAATLRAALAYLQHDRAGSAPAEALLLGSRRGGGLHGTLGVRSIQARVQLLGAGVGLTQLSPHDLRPGSSAVSPCAYQSAACV